MEYIKNLGWGNIFMLILCLAIIIVAEYLFLNGYQLHGIFIGLWAPMLIGILIFIKLINDGK